MLRRPPRSTLDRSSAASDVYKRQIFARRVIQLAQGLRWHNLYCLLVHTQDWVTFGQNEELEELMTIEGLSGEKSRALYEAGYVNAKLITHAKPYNIYKVLQSAIGWNDKEQSVSTSINDIESIQAKARRVYMKKAKKHNRHRK
eukprot:TRINITY_DN3378_c0_g1_i5.p1 TRINITY_DN3378_c0_g1~~TRINITY_DN3378_c0_g1_i5.p1  ORF type:complete len:151 (+),score=27.77 TRINITY_DN3378_c0_g1_i5:24-455(+)